MNRYTNNENKKECEGCCVRDICILIPSYIDPKTNETIECPCAECIVKTMCRGNRICKEYKEYHSIIMMANYKGNLKR